MKILYAIQGTGNGHLSRAAEIIPLLQKRCQTDILVSGDQTEMNLTNDIKYRLQGLSFVYSKKGGIDYRKTYKKANTKRFLNEINDLPINEYDFILNDFEPVSAWAAYKNKIPCIALSHQSSLLDRNVPKPSYKDTLGKFILKNYAPSSHYFGLHFNRYSKNIFTPVIRKEIREAKKTDEGHYTVYLPAYDDDELSEILGKVPDVKWHVFSKSCSSLSDFKNISIRPIDKKEFIKSLASGSGVLCAAGFETPAETLFLGKKLMVIPVQNQYEQQYNAAALKNMGIPVIKKLKPSQADKIREWVFSDYRVEIAYPDMTDRIINRIFEMYVEGELPRGKWKLSYQIRP